MIVLQKPSFSHRLLAVPMMFLHVPRLHDFKRVFNGLRHELTSQVPVLYLSIVFFNVAGGIFNTSLTPSMSRNNLSQSDIYAVYLMAMVIQVIAFRYAAPYIARRTLVKTAVGGLVIRSICYASMGVSVYLVSGIWYIVPSIIFYPIAAGIAYAIYYTSSSTDGVQLPRLQGPRIFTRCLQRPCWDRFDGRLADLRFYFRLSGLLCYFRTCGFFPRVGCRADREPIKIRAEHENCTGHCLGDLIFRTCNPKSDLFL